MQKKKAFIPNAKDLMNQWQTGPLSDKLLTPGHGRGVIFFYFLKLSVSIYEDFMYEFATRHISNRIFRSWIACIQHVFK